MSLAKNDFRDGIIGFTTIGGLHVMQKVIPKRADNTFDCTPQILRQHTTFLIDVVDEEGTNICMSALLDHVRKTVYLFKTASTRFEGRS
jgi:hypothetical protein